MSRKNADIPTLGAMLKQTARYIRRTVALLGGQQLIHWPGLVVYASQNLIMNYMISWLLAQVVAAAVGRSMSLLGRGLLYFTLFFVVYMAVLCVGVYWVARGQSQMHIKLLRQGYARLLNMPLIRMGTTGDTLSRLENDMVNTANLAGMQLGNCLMGPIGGIGACAIVWGVHPLLLAVAMASSLIAFGTEMLLVRPNRQASDEIQRLQGKKTELLDDMIAGGLTVRLLNLQGAMDKRLWASLMEIAQAMMKRFRLGMLSALGGGISQWLAMGGVTTAGLWLALEGRIEIQDIMMAVGMSGSITMMLTSLSGSVKTLQTYAASAQRSYELIDADLEDHRAQATEARPDPTAPMLAGEGISFGYEPGKKVLQGVRFSVERGQTLALVGESGSGKSTLLRLMMNLYLPDTGDIRLQGQSFRAMPLEDWRKQFAYVPQDSPLFDGTVADNIGLGRLGATRDEIVAAAKAAYAHDFIMALPQGYETPMGEGATRISGGQRQRIAIARAILRDAPVLLLDEATSSLDTESEREVQAALERLMAGRATVVVAHRLSTIQRADTILVLDGGRVVEAGSHEALMDAGGVYAAMLQAGSIA